MTKYQNNDLAQIPKIEGTTAREGSALVPYPIDNYTAGPSEPLVLDVTLGAVCAAYNTSVLRNQDHLASYRYQWAGNFSDIDGNGVPWLGAYHYSDLYMFFGTYLITPGQATELEVQTSAKMQDLLLDFVKDPSCLPSNGWPEYDTSAAGGGQIARFGADGQILQLVDGNDVDGACHLPGVTYDTTP